MKLTMSSVKWCWQCGGWRFKVIFRTIKKKEEDEEEEKVEFKPNFYLMSLLQSPVLTEQDANDDKDLQRK